YQGDFIWYWDGPGVPPDEPGTAFRFGSFMRPYHLFPRPDQTLLFYEGRFAQAYLSTEPYANGSGFNLDPVTVPSWHNADQSIFNALMADGHTQRIRLTKEGPAIDPSTFDPETYPLKRGMIRGPGWRYDAFPEVFIVEGFSGDPMPQTPGLRAATEQDVAPQLQLQPMAQ
ncbi:MAG: hypothetical protein V3T70_05895, partial [Phycisphaerae bacterium]